MAASTAGEFISAHVDVPYSGDLELVSGTISFCFKDINTLRDAGLFSKDSSGFDDGGHLTIRTDGAGLEVRLQSTDASYYVVSDPIELDRWFHVVFTFGSEGMKLYMDGQLVDEDAYDGGLVGNTEPFVFGANTWGSGNGVIDPLSDFISGLIDEVIFFDYSLSEQQVTTLYEAKEGQDSACPMVITRTWTATDICGNIISCEQTVTVDDTIAPVITCPADIIIECGEPTDPTFTGEATTADGCDPNPVIAFSDEISGPGPTTYVDAVDEFDPIHHWRMGESPGATVCVDRVSSLDGAYNNVELGRSGAVVYDPDAAGQFINAYAEIPHGTDLELANGTVSFCFKDINRSLRGRLNGSAERGTTSHHHESQLERVAGVVPCRRAAPASTRRCKAT